MDKFDFSGWATRNDLLCGDGRTIRKNAFKENDGTTVPLIWNHDHNNPDAVLGHALLENREEGVYAYCTLNDSESGKTAKKLVEHGDVRSLSIYANKLKQIGGDVIHGSIRELSLVLAGANPGAYIDFAMAHGDDEEDTLTANYDESGILIYHSDDKTTNEGEVKMEGDKKEKTIGEIFDTLTEEQKNAVYAIIGQVVEDQENSDDEGDDEKMKHNVFDNDIREDVLTHSEMETIITDAKRYGSLKESFLAHTAEYGIDNINWLFGDPQNLTEQPGFVKRQPDGWVATVMNGVHHTPFSRIKMMFADITADEARAKGYTKGNLKKEEVFGLLKRVVEPTTIYKKQKLDRDDILDITDFDVVAFLKGEMRTMLDEEIARAILFGDGRSSLSQDKINPANIIPVVSDADLYAIKKKVVLGTNEELSHGIIRSAVEAQNDYQGSGSTTFYAAAPTITTLLLMEDKDGHRMYKDVAELALAMNVSRIVKVPTSVVPDGIYGVIVDLNDYNVGADKGGAINMFDDFDIDYNQQKYLIETRCSGALTKPYSAIVLKVDDTVVEDDDEE